jgi:NAD(P)-dependent dehydrogenase (short-subunit alcohol dehydrogenase family)
MSTRLDGRAAIVTGAARGIGRAAAQALAAQGAAVVVNDLGVRPDGSGADPGPAREVVQEIEAAGGRAVANADSVSEFDAAGRIVATALEAFGRIDVLVNNAGLAGNGSALDCSAEDFGRISDSHIRGTFNCTRHAAPHMKEQGWGRIVNLVSRAGLVGTPNTVAYGAGKGGVFGFTNVAARDLAPFGITVNAVNPSSTDTRMVAGALENSRDADGELTEMARNLAAVMQRPEQVAVVIAFLCTEAAADVTGEIFFVRKNEVALYQPMQLAPPVSRDEDWTVEALAGALKEFELHPLDTPY